MKKQTRQSKVSIGRKKVILLVLVASLLFVLVYVLAHITRESALRENEEATPTPLITVSPSSVASPSITASSTPAASTSPTSTTVSSLLPDSLNTQIERFYTSYTDQNRDELSKYFSKDVSSSDMQLHALLFTGMDTNGIPGGPTLFASESASERPTSYTLKSANLRSGQWTVVVTEKRISVDGTQVGTATTEQVWAQQSGQWLLTTYQYQGKNGKYGAFISQ